MSTSAPPIERKRTNYRPKTSKKPQAIKTAIIAKRSQGQTTTQIARDLGITRNTVNGIIEQSGIEQYLEDGTLQCARLIPESIRVVKHRLEKNSETAAFKVLEGLGVLGEHRSFKKSNDASLQIAIQNLIMPHTSNSGSSQSTSTETPAIEVKSIESSDT